MTKPSFAEWVAHWGEPRLAEIIAGSQKCYRSMWEERDGFSGPWQFPAWELCLGAYWDESLADWHSRWQRCGGRLCDGRMIAAKWDGIWARLSSTFYDGLGHPYPPYARSSCAHWMNVGQDEAIVTGAISESELNDYMARFPREPLKDKDGNPISKELLQAALDELDEHIYRSGGPRPGANREERVAHERKRREESFARSQAEYEQRNRERDRERAEQNAAFRLLEQVEASFRESPSVADPRRWEWLCNSVNTLTPTKHFDRYPNWQARAWVACAELHRLASDSASELTCLEHALSINPKLPVKRRIKKLQSQHECA
jgi:hypothetical protein